MVLSFPAWFFALQPWKLCSVSFGMPLECFIVGIKSLELPQTWNLLEPLGVLALLMEQTVEHIVFLLTWWQVLPHKSLSSMDNDVMDLLVSKQESFMDDPVGTWF